MEEISIKTVKFESNVERNIAFIVDNLRFLTILLVLIFDVFNQLIFNIKEYYIGELGVTLLLIFSTNYSKFEKYKLFYIFSALIYYFAKSFYFDISSMWVISLLVLSFGDLDLYEKYKSNKNN